MSDHDHQSLAGLAGQTINELWWEENDMHVIFSNGTHIVYKDAWITSYERDEIVDENGNAVVTTEKIEFNNVKSDKE